MEAFIFTLSIFAFWGLIGFSTLTIFDPRLKIIQGVLIAPAVGVAITIIPVYLINRAGFPVKDFGALLLAALSITATVAIAVKRPIFPSRRLIPHLSILLVAGVLVARPMFLYGFDWLSFSNDDMANYCLAAQRFLNHGFFEQLDIEKLRSGRDYTSVYWFMHADVGTRSGSELMLAVIWALSGLNAHQIFMPVIVALHLTLVAAGGALATRSKDGNRSTLLAMALISISPMTTLGTLYQLIGQAGGMALVVAVSTLMYRPIAANNAFSLLRISVSAGLVLVALLIWYPEILPFFGLGWVLYFFLLMNKDKKNTKKNILGVLAAVPVGVIVIILLNHDVLTILKFLFKQLNTGTKFVDINVNIFPFFLVPSGIGAFWGLIPIAISGHESLISLSIAVGIILFIWLITFVIPHQLKKATPPIGILLVMLLMGMLLFFRNNAFGLYKLSMFLQPFLIGSVAISLGRSSWRNTSIVTKVATPLVITAMLLSQFNYVSKSTGEFLGSFNEVPFASSMKINRQFKELLLKNMEFLDENSILVSDADNVVIAKYQALYSLNTPIFYKSKDFFAGIDHDEILSPNGRLLANASRQYSDKDVDGQTAQVLMSEIFAGKNIKYIISKDGNIFNRFEKKGNHDEKYFSLAKPVNHLQFINSNMGNHYFLGDRKKVSFYQLENDPMIEGEVFSAIGRYILVEVTNPSKKARVVMEITDTVLRQFGGALPRPNVHSEILQFVGRGSGRVFSDVIDPTIVDGIPYISIDMGRDGLPFPSKKTGLMLLFGKDVPLDSRLVTAFGRDISLISDDQYLALIPPSELNRFPLDLTNKNLQYSGIYEDGWISERAFFVLTKPSEAKTLVVSGMIPKIIDSNFFTDLTISLNGKTVSVKRLGMGNFKFDIPVVSSKTMNRIDFSFSNYQQLPGEDGRFIGGKLEYLGFK